MLILQIATTRNNTFAISVGCDQLSVVDFGAFAWLVYQERTKHAPDPAYYKS